MSPPPAARPGPWDPGLQSERTALAWQRTLLSGLACALVVARLLALVSGPAAVVTGIAALVTTAALAVLARRRSRRNDAALRQHRPLADARAPLLLCVLVVLTAAGAAVVVLGAGPQS
ncbi:Uncharacterized membrane protein YidH, DUF202 family [Friedmanniella luteola]|uniref:Uncharacterized membrane protein YidH, DUF202 family n=1 Tax=Friedmanniella luteola TaxID=546871 RepID=A0A1H1ZQ08_9ACTN|nr:DUF202 domain-containing protein [Friedmanniella luteola]SDT35689.1 Uncharacterized membrane protein YidH, DUF202 family [Friedmanniella luteola]